MTTSTLKRWEFERKFALLVTKAAIQNIRFITTSFLRTPEQQNSLFLQGLTNCDGYKKKSMHQLGRARDIVILDAEGDLVWVHTADYDYLGNTWEAMGGTHGGRWFKEGKTKFNDIFHYEM